jgi:hypothetical protein
MRTVKIGSMGGSGADRAVHMIGDMQALLVQYHALLLSDYAAPSGKDAPVGQK